MNKLASGHIILSEQEGKYVGDTLDFIRDNIEEELIDSNLVLYEVAYRPIDCGIFGREGYTAIFKAKAGKWKHGIVFAIRPTVAEMSRAVESALTKYVEWRSGNV